MSIYSEFCLVTSEQRTAFDNTGPGVVKEMRKLVCELNAQFGLRIGAFNSLGSYNPSVALLSEDGITCGNARVSQDAIKEGKIIYRYFVQLPTIRKEKASANSPRDTRDSSSIATIIRAIKKNKEEPLREKLYADLYDGIRYPFQAVQAASSNKPSIRIDGDMAEAVARKILGIDDTMALGYITQLRQSYDKFQYEMKLNEAATKEIRRYRKGTDIVCITRDNAGAATYYLVGETVQDPTDSDKVVLQGTLKRYNSLADTRLAPTIAMIKTYMQGQAGYDRTNEFGVPLGDNYYKDIDVATGYSNRNQLWIAIPKNAE